MISWASKPKNKPGLEKKCIYLPERTKMNRFAIVVDEGKSNTMQLSAIHTRAIKEWTLLSKQVGGKKKRVLKNKRWQRHVERVQPHPCGWNSSNINRLQHHTVIHNSSVSSFLNKMELWWGGLCNAQPYTPNHIKHPVVSITSYIIIITAGKNADSFIIQHRFGSSVLEALECTWKFGSAISGGNTKKN